MAFLNVLIRIDHLGEYQPVVWQVSFSNSLLNPFIAVSSFAVLHFCLNFLEQ